MDTIFSHIIQKRLSQVNEDVATDALGYILQSSELARGGMMKFLKIIGGELPDLHFYTQKAEDSIRPDMWGLANSEPYVFIENKFWAGLTDNQPVSYLEHLAKYDHKTILLFVAPAKREETLWRELLRRLTNAGIEIDKQDAPPGVLRSGETNLGPILSLTSWSNLLSKLSESVSDDLSAKGDIAQLRGLCEVIDKNAFTPISLAELSDQRTPAFIMQLSSVVEKTIKSAVTKNVLNIKGLMPQASKERIGRYLRIPEDQGVGAWLGIHFGLWRKHGGTPLWLIFGDDEWGRAQEVQQLIEMSPINKDIPPSVNYKQYAIPLYLPTGQEKDAVVRYLVDRLREIAEVLGELSPKTVADDLNETSV